MKTIKSLTEDEIAELPTLIDEWKWVKIGELCDVVRGGSPRPAGDPKFYGGTIPFLKVADLTRNEGAYLKSFEFTIKEAGLQKTRLVKPKTLLLSNSGATLGVPKICLFETTFNDGIAAFLNLDEESLLFHYYYWVSKTKKLRAINQGAAQPNLNTNIISEMPFPLAPLPEQRAIVSKIEQLFSELDNGISNLKLAQEQIKVYRQAVLKKAFEGELTKKWREQQTDLLDTKDLLEQIIKEREEAVKVSGKKLKPLIPLTEEELEKLPKLPEKWYWVKNEELIHYVTSGSRDWKQFYSEKGAYFIRTQDIKTNSLSLEEVAFVDLPDKVEGKRSLVEKDDLLMTITGANVGKVAHINFEIPEAYVSQSVALMKYVDKRIVPFLHYYFQTYGFGATLINNLVYGMGRPVLSLENMREVPVSLCSLSEQRQIIQEIETRLSVCDKIEQDIETNMEKAEALRQSILKKAFEGKLLNERELAEVRKTEDWEPAEALLEKIKVEKTRK